MTTIDVGLRLRLENKVSREADEAKKDLNELRSAAERLGKTRSGDMNAGLEKIGRSAVEARQAINGVGSEADEVRKKIGRVGDGAFEGLKADANQAANDLDRVGRAANDLKGKLSALRGAGGNVGPTSGAPYRPTPGPTRERIGAGIGGMVDQFGLPVAVGGGVAYMAGGAAGIAVVGAGAAINAAAGDEQRSDALRSTGGYNAQEQKRFDKIIGRAGERHGVGTEAAQGVFGVLQAGGLDSADAAALVDNVVKFAVGTKSDANESAGLTIALRSLMGIDPANMVSAYDAIATGGNNGRFEIKDMARNFPGIFARMATRGSSGMQGVRTAAAMSQPIAEVSGSNEEAATAYEAMLDDLFAPDVRERAKKYGFDPYAEMDAAKERGEDPILGTLKRVGEVFGNNREAFSDVFRNNTAAPAYRAIIDNIARVEELIAKMEGASGTVDESYEVNTDNFNTQKDRMLSTVGKRIKDSAAPVLPTLTKAMKDAADALQRQEEESQRKANMDRFFETIFSQLPKPEKVPAWKRFLFGEAADPNWDPKEHFGITLRPSAESAMGGYGDGIKEEGQKVETIATGIRERLLSILNFNASPTITPNITPTIVPSSPPSAAKGQQSSVTPSNFRIDQSINSPNAKHAGRQAAREIQRAQARSLYDTGRRLA
ncbi:MAG: phage tail tape measure protein [Rhizobiaceae bacterium]|nr:phage tail tape measure protein [Rhizobiaceae bacterium]MCZ8352970.1 phage tail tape measure protein [Rhizobium sp.]